MMTGGVLILCVCILSTKMAEVLIVITTPPNDNSPGPNPVMPTSPPNGNGYNPNPPIPPSFLIVDGDDGFRGLGPVLNSGCSDGNGGGTV